MQNLCNFYALSCGEKLSPKVHLWRKNDKYQVCERVWQKIFVLAQKIIRKVGVGQKGARWQAQPWYPDDNHRLVMTTTIMKTTMLAMQMTRMMTQWSEQLASSLTSWPLIIATAAPGDRGRVAAIHAKQWQDVDWLKKWIFSGFSKVFLPCIIGKISM